MNEQQVQKRIMLERIEANRELIGQDWLLLRESVQSSVDPLWSWTKLIRRGPGRGEGAKSVGFQLEQWLPLATGMFRVGTALLASKRAARGKQD